MAAEERSELLAAVNSLRDDDREVLGARFLLDLTEAETSEALGIPRGTVKSRTSRALGRLREALGGEAAPPRPSATEVDR
jgi:RNA polymerase sigma-70 factor (ECF subfamily)